MTDKNNSVPKAIQALRGARLAAVQAMFQIELTSKSVDYVVREFNEYRLTDRVEKHSIDAETDFEAESGDAKLFANREFFTNLVKESSADRILIDAQISKRLTKGWTIERIDPISRAILRCAIYELMNYLDIPVPVIINEYVSIAASFADGKNAGFVNGMLEKTAQETGAAKARESITE